MGLFYYQENILQIVNEICKPIGGSFLLQCTMKRIGCQPMIMEMVRLGMVTAIYSLIIQQLKQCKLL